MSYPSDNDNDELLLKLQEWSNTKKKSNKKSDNLFLAGIFGITLISIFLIYNKKVKTVTPISPIKQDDIEYDE